MEISAAGTSQLMREGTNSAKKSPKLHHTFLPDHEGRDVAKGTKRTARVGRDHHIDAGRADESSVACSHGHHDGAHHQRRRQIIRDRGYEKRQHAGQPEHCTKGEAE